MDRKAIIFDLDGTLWNSVDSFVVSCNTVLASQKSTRRTTIEDIQRLMGQPSHELARRLFSELSEKDSEILLSACFDQHMKDLALTLPPFYEGVPEGLLELSKRFNLFLVSNCDSTYLNHFLTQSPVGHLFLDAECAGRTGQPKGTNIRLLMDRNHLQNAVYIGDTHLDALAAKEAGVEFIFVTYGCGTTDEPCPRVSSFTELVKKLLSSPMNNAD